MAVAQSGVATVATAAAERGVPRAMLVALVAGVAASTVLHLAYPGVLRVPSLDGVPRASLVEMLVADLVTIGLASLCFAHARRRHGLYLATAFLVGSFVFTGVEETMWILLGRFGAHGTYWFTRGFFWFFETPVSACVGWFLLAYACTWVAETVFPSWSTTRHAALAGFLAMDLDLWLDPIQTHPAHRSWVWADRPGGIDVLSIPVTNFIGWFLLIFLFALVFDRLPARVRAAGERRATIWFFGVLLALEAAILAFFVAYGAAEQALAPVRVNLTMWGL